MERRGQAGRVKRYVWLAVATAVAIGAILTVGAMTKTEPALVSVYTLQSKNVEKTVSCSGKIEASESQKVYTDVSCVMQQVFVKAGQQVSEGDVLCTVDVEATKQALATLGGVSPDMVPTDNMRGEVTAPVSGIVTTLNAAEGEICDSTKPCVVISPSDSRQVKVTIHERDLKSVQVGQTVNVSGVAFDKKIYHGTVKSISPSARQQYNGSVSETVVDAVVELNPEELDDSLRLGLTAKAKVVVASAKETIVIPYGYVLQDEQNKEYVYVHENGRAVKRSITTGEELPAGYQVTEGLRAGDQVITNPDAIEEDGAPITLKQSAKKGAE